MLEHCRPLMWLAAPEEELASARAQLVEVDPRAAVAVA